MLGIVRRDFNRYSWRSVMFLKKLCSVSAVLPLLSAMTLGMVCLTSGCSMPGPRMGTHGAGLSVPPAAAWDDAMAGETDVLAASAPTLPLPTESRQLAYRASVHLLVEDVAAAQDALMALATAAGGHLQALTAKGVTLRIPVGKFNEVLGKLSDFGQVIHREISTDDVTDRVVDMKARIDNLEILRKRLGALLTTGGTIEELLLVEKEMARVTGEIEQLKARLKHLQESVAYSILEIQLNAPAPIAVLEDAVPFAWVRSLGEDVRMVPQTVQASARRRRLGFGVELPAAFIVLQQDRDQVRALSGDGDQILVRRWKNFEGATLDFWERTARRWLAAGSLVRLTERTETRTVEQEPAVWLIGSRSLGQAQYRYVLGMTATRDHVYTFEAWGRAESLDVHRPDLVTSFRAMQAR